MKTIHLAKRSDQVALITFDSPGRSINLLSNESLAAFQLVLKQVIHDPDIRACVLTSAKEDNFIAGADLKSFYELTSKEVEDLSRRSQSVLEEIAKSPIPVVAAVQGSALGLGLEIILACASRVASNDSKTVLAFPEVQLGLLPGAGGTQRLFRAIGLRESLPMLLTGKRIRAIKAQQLGLVDRLISPEECIEEAARVALELAKQGRRRISLNHLSFLDRVLMLPVIRTWILRQAGKTVMRKTRGLYPAPLEILKCIEIGLSRGVEAGLRKESESFSKLVKSPESKNLVWLFQATRELKKPTKTETKTQPDPKTKTGENQTEGVKKLAVIGAGLMGEGIAAISVPLSQVILKDVSSDVLKRAKDHIETALNKRVKSGAVSSTLRTKQSSRLKLATQMSELEGTELVIEAVFEDLKLKRQILSEVEQVVSPTTVFASNTSALPISQIAALAKNPERVLGMHYFSPVPQMPLLEIIVTPKTSRAALAVAQSYGIAQGKTVIVVKDGPGFYTTRILAPLLNESILLLTEGASIDAIDSALKNFGFPVGPIALLDEVGIDVGAHVSESLGKAFSDRSWGESDVLKRLNQAGYGGKKNKKGFYLYSKQKKNSGKKEINSKVYEFFGGPKRKRLPSTLIADRIAMMMVNEAVYCLQEEVISSPRDGDIGAVFGLGFPPFRGGPFHYLDSLGLANAVEKMHELAKKFGPRFKPAPLLQRLAQEKRSFYEVNLSQ